MAEGWYLALSPWAYWVVAALLLAILETLSLQFFALGLALGCLGGALGSLLGSGWAVGTFSLVTGLALLGARRLLTSGFLRPGGAPTNVTALIGARGQVIVPIVALQQAGRVLVEGEDWWAVTADGADLPLHAPVRVLAVEASRLVVEPLHPGETSQV